MPSSFCSFMQNGQWSVLTTERSLVRSAFHNSFWCPSARERNGVEHTYFAPSKSGRRQVLLEREVQVLRTRLAEDVPAVVARGGQRRDRLLGRHVHDVERRTGHARQHDRAMGGLFLGLPRPGQSVVARRGLAAGDGLRDEDVDRDAVLRVHHDERAVRCRGLHRAHDLAVVGVEDARDTP